MKRCQLKRYNFQIKTKMSKENKTSDNAQNGNDFITDVGGMLPLTEYAKEKLEYINGSCIARGFPKEQPTKQWAGAVLDLLEELGLGNYR